MTAVKVWCGVIALVLLALLGAHVYTEYLAVMPLRVWRVVTAIWTAWAVWHTYRSRLIR
ncbi:hypothetical protein [Burkholderia cenocepacia]|uniref:hypothetical protein n=1 Tax=Burkholderia cenocepacia TaxID=95486 RepID=UPI002AB79653|nr:hypothetical protein [Burkholderia cenocepacia]